MVARAASYRHGDEGLDVDRTDAEQQAAEDAGQSERADEAGAHAEAGQPESFAHDHPDDVPKLRAQHLPSAIRTPIS